MNPNRRRAFTLIELLAIIATLLLLAATLLPALARSKPNTSTAQCLNNLKQLSCGMMLYLADNQECFPGPGSRATYGFVPQDWIYWRVGPAYPPLAKSPIIAGFASTGTNLFRCPKDKDDSDRIARCGPVGSDPGPYLWSYSFTSFGFAGGTNLGLSSIFSGGTGYLFRSSQVQNPAGKIMLAEEQASLKPTEASDTNFTASIISDGRFVPLADALTVRHNGQGNVSFVDGHAFTVSPQFATNLVNTRPDF